VTRILMTNHRTMAGCVEFVQSDKERRLTTSIAFSDATIVHEFIPSTMQLECHRYKRSIVRGLNETIPDERLSEFTYSHHDSPFRDQL